MVLNDEGDRLAKLEERVFQNHGPSIKEIRDDLHSLGKKMWLVIVFLAANFGTSIMGLLK